MGFHQRQPVFMNLSVEGYLQMALKPLLRACYFIQLSDAL